MYEVLEELPLSVSVWLRTLYPKEDVYGPYWEATRTAYEGRLKELWFLGPEEKKTRGKTNPKYAESSLKEEVKKLLVLHVAYKRENNGLKFYQRTLTLGKPFNIQDN